MMNTCEEIETANFTEQQEVFLASLLFFGSHKASLRASMSSEEDMKDWCKSPEFTKALASVEDCLLERLTKSLKARGAAGDAEAQAALEHLGL